MSDQTTLDNIDKIIEVLKDHKNRLDALEARAQPDSSRWQPIETAPKDGTVLIMWAPHGPFLCAWNDGTEWNPRDDYSGGYWSQWLDGEEYHLAASPLLSHWMALPEPPK